MADRTAISAAAIRTVGDQALGVVADDWELPFEALDDVNGNVVKSTGTEILVFQNTAVGAQTVTLTAAPDAYGRTGAITAYSLDPDEVVTTEVLRSEVWAQADGNIYIDASDAAVKVAVLRLSSR